MQRSGRLILHSSCDLFLTLQMPSLLVVGRLRWATMSGVTIPPSTGFRSWQQLWLARKLPSLFPAARWETSALCWHTVMSGAVRQVAPADPHADSECYSVCQCSRSLMLSHDVTKRAVCFPVTTGRLTAGHIGR